MKSFALASMMLLCVVALTMAAKKDVADEAKIRVGVLDLVSLGEPNDSMAAMDGKLALYLNDIGFYVVSDQKAIVEQMKTIHMELPRHCSDPRCVRDIGRSVNMERMVYGSLDKNGTSYGARLTMLDVETRQVIESVSLEGESGVAGSDVLKAAVAKLHGQGDEDLVIRTNTYFGPAIHNEKQMLVAGGVCLGAGLIWGIASGGFSSTGNKPPWQSEFNDMAQSGIASAGYIVPMSGRATGMGNSYLAVSDDAYGVFYNPAGSAWVPNAEASVSYQSRFGMVNNIAASYVNKATRDIGFGEAFLYNGDTAGLLTEMTFISSAAYKFNQLLPFLRPLSVGAALKLISKTTPVIEGATAAQKTFGMGLDLGVLWELSDKIRYGLLVRDIVEFEKVNNNIEGVTGYTYYDHQPISLNMGGKFQVGYATMLVANGQIPLYKDQAWKMAGGLEQELFHVLRIRLGAEKEILAKIESTPWKFTGGFGLAINTDSFLGKYLAIDGAYEYNTIALMSVFNTSIRVGF